MTYFINHDVANHQIADTALHSGITLTAGQGILTCVYENSGIDIDSGPPMSDTQYVLNNTDADTWYHLTEYCPVAIPLRVSDSGAFRSLTFDLDMVVNGGTGTARIFLLPNIRVSTFLTSPDTSVYTSYGDVDTTSATYVRKSVEIVPDISAVFMENIAIGADSIAVPCTAAWIFISNKVAAKANWIRSVRIEEGC